MKIGIVGVGMVGEVVKYGMERLGHDVLCHDKKLHTSINMLWDRELIFVCVPTPSLPDGSCDVSIVQEVVAQLDGYKGLVVIKSTVRPGTTDNLNLKSNMRIAFCPEFLKEKSRFVDFIENHDICIIGAYNEEDYELIKAAHGTLPKHFEWLTPKDAEMAKYFSNVFNAVRIVFANQFFEVCEKSGCNYTAIKNAITKRQNIGDHYLDCNKNFRAFGGNCLPKDTKAFARFARQVGVDMPLLWNDIIVLNDYVAKGEKYADKVA